jgi:hypothetical protein
MNANKRKLCRDDDILSISAHNPQDIQNKPVDPEFSQPICVYSRSFADLNSYKLPNQRVSG